MKNKILSNDEFQIVVGEPTIVAQGPKYIVGWAGWGYFQFPKIYKRYDGVLYVSCTAPDARDSGLDYEKKPCKYISLDNGKTWESAKDCEINEVSKEDPLMQNGKIFVGFETQNSYVAEWIENYTPTFKSEYIQHNVDGDIEGVKAVFIADDIKEYNKTLMAKEFNPKTGKISYFTSTINWPGMPVVYSEERVLALGGLFALQNKMGITQLDNGSLIFAAYASDSNPQAKGKCGIYVFQSDDNARTWNLISKVLIDYSNYKGGLDGFTEPFIHKMPDGSFVMLMRTGYNTPTYIVRSTDECKTWSNPAYFDKLGVLPQMVTLDCGVTIASYGRPGIFIRATSDISGEIWQEPIDINIPVTCSYTGIVAISENKALLVYSDFEYPSIVNSQETAKTILVKEITVQKR